MNSLEFEIRISDQIQTVPKWQMAVGPSWATFEILFEYCEFAVDKNIRDYR
jgi:hypothetical protein